MRIIAVALLIFNCFPQAKAQFFTLEGQVVNADNKGISGAYLITDKEGLITLTNDSGFFKIEFKGEKGRLLIKKPGYLPQNLVFPYNRKEHLIITLDRVKPQPYFDAERIIRLAIENRENNREKYMAYKADIYKKNTAYLYKVPFEVPWTSGIVIPSKNDIGILFQSEKLAAINYNDAFNFDENIKAYHTAGRVSIPDWNILPDFDFSLYREQLYLRNISAVPYKSPISERSMKSYIFTPVASFYEGSRTVYRIKIEPRKKFSPNFTGYLEIYGDSIYNFSSLELKLGDYNLLEVVDSLHLSEVYYYSGNTYHKASQQLNYFMNVIGFSGMYSIVTHYSNQDFIDKIQNDTLDRQVITLPRNSLMENPTFWDSIRPLPLDSHDLYIQNKYQHPVRWILHEQTDRRPIYRSRPFKWQDLMISGYDFDSDSSTLKVSPLWFGLGYNTVEGFYWRYDLNYTRHFKNADLTFKPELRYGLASDHFYYQLYSGLLLDRLHPKKFNITLGHSVSQFNENEPIIPIINAGYALFLGRNFLKLYQKDFIKLGYDWEIKNGFEASVTGEYAHRHPLYNNTNFLFLGDPDNFTSNNPDDATSRIIDASGFDVHSSLKFHLSLFYQFRQLYKVVNNRKVNLPSNAPRVYFDYIKGLPTSISTTNYDFLSLGFYFQKRLSRFGLSKFDISGGSFVNNALVHFPDFKHFNGVRTFFLQPKPRLDNDVKEFSTLPYYSFSTKREFLEMHYEHNFDGLLIGNGGYLSKFKLHSFLGFNYLNTFARDQFLEFFIGMDNILNVMRLEFAGGFDNFVRFRPSVRIGFDFDYRYYFDHRKSP